MPEESVGREHNNKNNNKKYLIRVKCLCVGFCVGLYFFVSVYVCRLFFLTLRTWVLTCELTVRNTLIPFIFCLECRCVSVCRGSRGTELTFFSKLENDRMCSITT